MNKSVKKEEKIIYERIKNRPKILQNAIIAALYTDPAAVKEMINKCFTEKDLKEFRNERYRGTGGSFSQSSLNYTATCYKQREC